MYILVQTLWFFVVVASFALIGTIILKYVVCSLDFGKISKTWVLLLTASFLLTIMGQLILKINFDSLPIVLCSIPWAAITIKTYSEINKKS